MSIVIWTSPPTYRSPAGQPINSTRMTWRPRRQYRSNEHHNDRRGIVLPYLTYDGVVDFATGVELEPTHTM
jgi:hypothetical protein